MCHLKQSEKKSTEILKFKYLGQCPNLNLTPDNANILYNAVISAPMREREKSCFFILK